MTVVLGNLINLPPIGRDILPLFPGRKDEPSSPADPSEPPPQGGGQTPGTGNGSGQTGSPPDNTSPGDAQPPSGANGHGAVSGHQQVNQGRIDTETTDDPLKIEAWARKAALEVQKNEQFASMVMKIAKPETAEKLALFGNDPNGSAGFSSVAAAYRENQDDGPETAPDL
ncbi:hypothetical protein AB2N04_09075 [Nitratireductor sp. GISD-1A_MAKvit]|uniref:hypothetical protein n=1 Tax=Nitratireductor sp. GISD-1A_MAKvit TaxID=3234198 RepID=UPI0034668601